jgi:hypothetical protein
VRVAWWGLMGRVHLQGSSLCGALSIDWATGRVGQSDDLTSGHSSCGFENSKSKRPCQSYSHDSAITFLSWRLEQERGVTQSTEVREKDRIYRINWIAKKKCESKKEKTDGGLAYFGPSHFPTY